jgi:hypothetical protein
VLGVGYWVWGVGPGEIGDGQAKDHGSIKTKFLILESAALPHFPKLSFGFY